MASTVEEARNKALNAAEKYFTYLGFSCYFTLNNFERFQDAVVPELIDDDDQEERDQILETLKSDLLAKPTIYSDEEGIIFLEGSE